MGDKSNRLILHLHFISVTNVIYITKKIKPDKKKAKPPLRSSTLEIKRY